MYTQKDSKEMINKGVRRKHKRRNILPNICLIDSKWVFKDKRDGRFRARLVTWGYTQITEVDFTNNYSPVVTDVTLHVILRMRLTNRWE